MDHRLHPRPYPQQQQQQQLPPSSGVTTTSTNIVTYAQRQLGVSVAEEKRKAFAECKAIVDRIAAQCRKKNRKYRDISFDVENDRGRCLHNLSHNNIFGPSDTRRITELVNKPVFYSGGLRAAEVVQGSVEDCYLVSALSGMTALSKLIEELCVARDEAVGVYGFIFYRDCYWVPVIVDDLVFTRIPRFEQLSISEKDLYHHDKGVFNLTARKGIDSLYFAKAGKTGDTWVPLVEKAFAKLHGDYASIMFGRTCDALEDITGGVSSLVLTKDILDIDTFWTEELLNANKDRIFACWFKAVDGGLGKPKNTAIDGLIGNLSHSVVKAVECGGKRFVILRDPWGEAGWQGPWCDGSKEWTPVWLERLPELGHDFSGNGQFVMEYKDFLNIWQEIQRTFIFDDSWVMSSQWLHLPEKQELSPWNYGDFAFTFSLPVASRTIISLTKANPRFFKDIQGAYAWNMDFILAKEGEVDTLGESSYSFFYTRSVSLDIDLEAGNYVILPRLDPTVLQDREYFKKGLDSGWNRRKLGNILTERAKSWSIAANWKPNEKLVVKPISEVLGGDLAKADKTALETLKTYGPSLKGSTSPSEGSGGLGDDSVTVTTTTTTQTVVSKKSHSELGEHDHPPGLPAASPHHQGGPYAYVHSAAGPQYSPTPVNSQPVARAPVYEPYYAHPMGGGGAGGGAPQYYNYQQQYAQGHQGGPAGGGGGGAPRPGEMPGYVVNVTSSAPAPGSGRSSPVQVVYNNSLNASGSGQTTTTAAAVVAMAEGEGPPPRGPGPFPAPSPHPAPLPAPAPAPLPLPLPAPGPQPSPYMYPGGMGGPASPSPQYRPYTPPLLPLPVMGDTLEDDNAIVVGLKVYTGREALVVITGRVRARGGGVEGSGNLQGSWRDQGRRRR